MAKDLTPLAAAAAAFDAELAVYARLGDVFLRTPMTTLKQLERANLTLSEIGDCEGRLQTAARQLIAALAASRQQQEQLSAQVLAHVPVLQLRNQRLSDLMTQMAALATDVAALNAQVLPGAGGDETDPPSAASADDVSAATFALSERAEQLANAAHEAEMDEIRAQAHALYQRLKAIGTKLQKAAGN
jgi:hypothetical protein